MNTTNEYAIGRVLLVRCNDALDGTGPTPQEVTATAQCCGARFILLDMTHTPYADSAGLRWLLALREELAKADRGLRIAARPGGKVWRNLHLLDAGLEIHGSVARAWRAPWEPYAQIRPRRTPVNRPARRSA